EVEMPPGRRQRDEHGVGDVVRVEVVLPREGYFRSAATPGRRPRVFAVVHEARVVATGDARGPVGVDVLPPALRQVGVQVLDRIQLVVEIAVDQRLPGPTAGLRALQGYNHCRP